MDLRDGVRLARLMELLTHTGGLSESLRVPAVSRLQKLHNVSLVYKRMQESNIGGGKCNRMLLIIISISLINRYFDVYDYQLSHCCNLYTICFFLRLKLSIRLINLDPSQILFLTSLATVDCNQEAKNIVDGNRDRTLFLLWQILFAFELRMVSFSSHFSWYFLYQSIYSLIYFSDPIHSLPYSLHSSILSYFSLLFSDFIFGTFS